MRSLHGTSEGGTSSPTRRRCLSQARATSRESPGFSPPSTRLKPWTGSLDFSNSPLCWQWQGVPSLKLLGQWVNQPDLRDRLWERRLLAEQTGLR